MSIKKETEEKKDFIYSHKTLNFFADKIINDYHNDYHKFCEKVGAIKDNSVINYKDKESYYKKYVENTPLNEVDDFFRPNIVKSYWDRLYKQSKEIRLAKVEELYSRESQINGEDPRRKKLQEIIKKFSTFNV